MGEKEKKGWGQGGGVQKKRQRIRKNFQVKNKKVRWRSGKTCRKGLGCREGELWGELKQGLNRGSGNAFELGEKERG